ncbi:MAG TPA: DinB family protein [Hymenobacter sp.]|jgi:uncharacterized damage-inducible protein DinB|uniref:DinB family protein n=1 Tax=Hymenobacter sp. TaxID=1898978 RepID=UPI002ED80BBB
MPPPETIEVWLRGPLPAVPPLLQPVAHALLQAREELTAALHDFPPVLLNVRPEGVASVGFHLQHLTGVLNRLLTYARKEMITEAQLEAFHAEVPPLTIEEGLVERLVKEFSDEVDHALSQLRSTDVGTLTDVRGVGRAQVPSTHLGILVHAAEHTTRHLGQLLVTARWVKSLA